MSERSPQELRSAAREIGYAIEMISHLPRHITATTIYQPVVLNACIESLLLHARAMIEFFWGPDPRTMHLRDFISNWGPSNSESKRRLLGEERDLNQYAIHLDWTRTAWQGPQTFGIPKYYQLAWDVVTVFTEFAERLSDTTGSEVDAIWEAATYGRHALAESQAGIFLCDATSQAKPGRVVFCSRPSVSSGELDHRCEVHPATSASIA